MAKNTYFRDYPGLDPGRHHVPGYTGHFPTQNRYQQISMSQATKHAMETRGGYFDHEIPHSVVENNREDPEIVRRRLEDQHLEDDMFHLRDHLQGGAPVYRKEMIPGFTGYMPNTQDQIGNTFAGGALEGTAEFERAQGRIPRYRFPLESSRDLNMRPIGGREMYVTGNIDRDRVPVDIEVPLWVPRYMGHKHKDIVRHYFPPPERYPGFDTGHNQACLLTKKPYVGTVHPPIHRDIHLEPLPPATGEPMEYFPKILPKPQQPHQLPVSLHIKQPKEMLVTVPMPTWVPTISQKMFKYYTDHQKSGFSGYTPNARNVLGSSINREITEENQMHLNRLD